MKFVYRYKPFEIPHLYTVLWNVSIWERYLKILSRKGLFGHKVETHILHFNRTELLSHFKYSLTLRSYYFIIFNLCSDFSQKMQGVTNFLLKIHNYNISNCFFRVCPTKTYPSGNKTKKRERNPSKLRPVAIWGNQGFDEDDRQGNQVVFLDYPEPIVPAGANFDRFLGILRNLSVSRNLEHENASRVTEVKFLAHQLPSFSCYPVVVVLRHVESVRTCDVRESNFSNLQIWNKILNIIYDFLGSSVTRIYSLFIHLYGSIK